MSTEQVVEFLTTRSIKGTFVVDPSVSRERVGLAIKRQKERTGYSFRLDRHPKR
jgi:hypothetical protein